MSSYIRKLSYLYYYENRRKGANAGYARLERRDGSIRFQMNIRYRLMEDTAPILYLYGKPEGGKWTLVPLGRCQIKNHQLIMRFARKEEEVFPEGIEIGDIQGILLPLKKNRCFASSWNEKEASEYFWLMDWIDIEGNVMAAAEPEPPGESKEETPEGIKKEDAQAVKAKNLPENQEITETAKEGEDFKMPRESEEPLQQENLQEGSRQKEEQEGASDLKTMEWTPPEQARDWLPVWEEKITPELVFSVYPSLPEFLACKKCIRIEPQDIGILPMESWFLASNSFLLHGYYNFNHLLLGWKTEKPEAFILGVPGIYDKREKIMAGMFGFGAFEIMGRRDKSNSYIPEGAMGYWYRYIDPLLRQDSI